VKLRFVGSGAAEAPATRIYDVGFNFVPIGKIKGAQVWEGAVGSETAGTAGTWIRPTDTDLLSYTFDERTYADFTVAEADTEAAE
jgi:hypothetical protein